MTTVELDSAGIADFHRAIGDTIAKLVTLYDADTGLALNLSGGTIQADIRASVWGSIVTAFTISDSDLANGTFQLNLSSVQITTTLGEGDWIYSVRITHGGVPETYLKGTIYIRKLASQ